MKYIVTQPKDYWIASNAVNITLNALGDKNRIQGSVVSGAVIMCFLEDVKPASQGGDPENGDGLYYGANHEPKRWPISISPTYFNSDTHKYVYAAVPRTEAIGTQAVIVFPSEELDIYGRARRLQNETGVYEQIGSTDYFYIYLNGIISAPSYNQGSGKEERGWERSITDWGKLETAQGREERQNNSDWYSYSQVNQVVTFLKEIAMRDGSSFQNLILNHKNLTDVVTSEAVAPIDSDTMVATPGYVGKFYLSKVVDDIAAGHITFEQGLRSVFAATFGTYNREAGTTPTGAAILPNGTGDFIDLIVRGVVRGSLTIEDLLTAKDIIFKNELKGDGARRGFTDGHGIYMNAKEGLIETDGMNVRGFMRVMELIINRLQLMESDYSFTEGDTVDHIDYENNGQTLVLTMHKDHDNDYTPFYPGDILYGKVNDLLPKGSTVPDGHIETKNGSYYTTWLLVKSVDFSKNQVRVAPYAGCLQDYTPIVPGAINFSPSGTAIRADVTSPMYEEYEAHSGEGYDTMLTLTRHGNVADGIDPDTGQYDEHIKQSQLGRQQSWVLSTTDKRLSFFWNFDTPIIKDEYYALCLGLLPNLANLPSTRNPNMPSLYINTLFADNIEQANYPARVVKTDRGQWQANPTAQYEGEDSGTWAPDGTTITEDGKTYGLYVQTLGEVGVPQTVMAGDIINEPYHYRTFTKSDWLAKRLSPSWRSKSDAALERMMSVNAPKADLEVSRAWNHGALWECLVDGTAQEPTFGCTDWMMISGGTFSLGFFSDEEDPVPIIGLSVRPGHVDETVVPYLLFGQEDISYMVTSWRWERESNKPDLDEAWNNSARVIPDDPTSPKKSETRKLHITVDDLPDGWYVNGGRVGFKCSAVFMSDGEDTEIINRITIT